ncbi:GntR family transcriptional regulator [Devosia nitrariae]
MTIRNSKESVKQHRPVRARTAPKRESRSIRDAAWRLVYESLRSSIVAMKMPPGTPIREKEIAAQFGLSRTPVREAVLRLADEGLIEVFPQSGTFVARIPYDDLPEAIVIRKALETAAVRMATERMSRSQELTLASIIERQREAAAEGDTEQFHRADEAFHAKIAEISGYPGIWKLVLQVKTQVDRFRQLTLLMPKRMFVVIEDHQAVLERMSARDAEGAAKALGEHLDAVLPALSEQQVQREDQLATRS